VQKQAELAAEMNGCRNTPSPEEEKAAPPAAKSRKHKRGEETNGAGAGVRQGRKRRRRFAGGVRADPGDRVRDPSTTGTKSRLAVLSLARPFFWMMSMIAADLQSGVELLGDMIATLPPLYPSPAAGISTNAGFPISGRGWIVDPQSSDPLRRVRGEPGCARRGLAAPLRDGADLAAAKPGRGQRAHGNSSPRRQVPAIITQNIDICTSIRLAPDHVVELHGNTTYARCIGCGRDYALAWVSSVSMRMARRPTARLR